MSELFADLDTLYTDGAEDQVNARRGVWISKVVRAGKEYVHVRHQAPL